MHINVNPARRGGGGAQSQMKFHEERLKLKVNKTSKHGLKAIAKRVNYIEKVFNQLNKCDVSNGN